MKSEKYEEGTERLELLEKDNKQEKDNMLKHRKQWQFPELTHVKIQVSKNMGINVIRIENKWCQQEFKIKTMTWKWKV